jgi:hypothetical protein
MGGDSMEREEKGKEKLEAMELEIPAKHPRAIEGNVMIFNIILSVIGAIIGLQILTTWLAGSGHGKFMIIHYYPPRNTRFQGLYRRFWLRKYPHREQIPPESKQEFPLMASMGDMPDVPWNVMSLRPCHI